VEIVLNVLFIFILRVLGVSLSTVRLLLMTRGRRLLSAVFGFFQTLVYAVAIGKVVQDLNNIPNLMSYCLGFSVGTLLGMWLEERIAVGFATIRVIFPGRNHQVVEAIRRAGHGATEAIAQGKEGTVGTVKAVVRRRDVETVYKIIRQYAPDAFITIEDTQKVEHGYLHATRYER
jgi:uncharacterized protein YebE (UPF0316 family)